MPINMESLLSRPMTPAPPDADSARSGADQVGMGSLQSLMQRGGGPQQGRMGPSPLADPETASALFEHLTTFQREWEGLLQVPGIGKKDVKGSIMEMMADMMGQGYVTLAAVMNQLKDLPTNPLGQKQWVEEHLRKAEQAAIGVLRQHAALSPPLQNGEFEQALSRSPTRTRARDGHADMMGRVVKHFSQGK